MVSSRPGTWESGPAAGKPTLLGRLTVLLVGLALAVLAVSVLVAAVILGSLIATVIGVVLVFALVVWSIKLAVRRARQ